MKRTSLERATRQVTYLRQPVGYTDIIHECCVRLIDILNIKAIVPLLDLVCTCVKYKPLACYVIALHKTERIIIGIQARISVVHLPNRVQYIRAYSRKPTRGNSELLVGAAITMYIVYRTSHIISIK